MVALEKTIKEPWIQKSEINNYDTIDKKYTYILIEQHVLYRPGVFKQFIRNIIRVNKSDDFSLVNPLQVTINNSMETCIFHNFKILRDGEVQEISSLLEFKELQREQGLEKNVYTESKTFVAYIEGLQINDIIDYSYTIINTGFLYQKNFTFIYQTIFTVPVFQQFLTVDYDNNNKECSVRIVKSFSEYSTSKFDGSQCYSYKNQNIDAILLESYIPSSENPFSYIEFSDFISWQDFGESLLGEYRKNENTNYISDYVIKNIIKSSINEEKIEEVINYVKTQIGYHSVSIDNHSFIPHDPLDVIRQNFGDCKDKSLLLKLMLETLGVEASVILVNTYETKNIVHRLISLSCFNHAIVAFNFNNQLYFVDPTDSCLFFKFSMPVEVDYGYYFDTIRYQLFKYEDLKNCFFDRSVYEKVSIVENTAVIEITDEYSFLAFSGTYSNYITNNISAVANNYLEFFKKRYSNIKVDTNSDPRYELEIENQKIKFIVSFIVEEIWEERESNTDRLYTSFNPSLLNEYLIYLQGSDRKYNHLWPHPVKFTYIFDIYYDFYENMGNLSEVIDCETFKYTVETIEKEKNYRYQISFVSKTDIINKEWRKIT